MLVLTIRWGKAKRAAQKERLAILRILRETNHNLGPAATKALPAAFVVNFSKFLI